MKLKSILAIITVFVFVQGMQAQKHNHRGNFDVEKHHREQADFFKKALELTDAESAVFIPLMQEYVHARFDLNRELRNAVRELKKKPNRGDADYQKVIDLGLEVRIKEAQLRKEYYMKFGKVISPRKVLEYSRAEKQFMQKAVRRHQMEND